MANIIPPLLSDTPPPPPEIDDHEEDEFGDFAGTNNFSYDREDSISPPGTPLQLPETESIFDIINDPIKPEVLFDINQNNDLEQSKDFCDKRKDLNDDKNINTASEKIEIISETSCDIETNVSSQNSKGTHIVKANTKLNITNQCEDLSNIDSIESIQLEVTKCRNGVENLSEIVTNNPDHETCGTLDKEKIDNEFRDFKTVDSKDADNETFDDFANFTTPSNEIMKNEEIGFDEKNIDDKETIDDFGDFTVPSNKLTKNETCGALEEEKIDNEFRDFATFDTKDADKETFNDFDNFTPPSSELVKNGEINFDAENIDDDFGEFTSLSSKNPDKETFDDFGDFTVSSIELTKNTIFEQEGITDDDFGDFAAIDTTSNFASFPPQTQNPDDDFGDFASNNPTIILLNDKKALEKSTEIIKEMFPAIEKTSSNFESTPNVEVNDKIFNQIKNITETHALSYQWSKSASQNLLLKSLNIDSRNILYGPGWNPSMPRFAANLSQTPLKPVKSEILTPVPAKEPPSQSDLPTSSEPIEFSSQSMLLDLEQLEAQLEIPNLNSSSPLNETESWEAWLDSIPSKSLNSLEPKPFIKLELNPKQPTSKTDLEQKHDDFDNFVSYSTPAATKNIILRETHISNNKDENISWLEPTIVTPELARKEREFIDEDFEDFQMIVPEDFTTKTSLTVKPIEVRREIVKKIEEVKPEIDDDFGDFSYSLPKTTLLEPLKPCIVQTPNIPISWPDPGITDEEISRFEALGLARAQNNLSNNKPEEEEWSDFVSVQQQKSPVHKLKTETRSSTPDLPLSVLNLGNVQPAKQPIPVITPNGLVQTKLSTNMSLNLNSMVSNNRIYTQQNSAVYQPSIISNQYKAYGVFGGANKTADEDEWSDFVSHQPSQPNQMSNWTNSTNNLNKPAVFSGASVQKQTASSVSIPDLDFLAPNKRTAVQRK